MKLIKYHSPNNYLDGCYTWPVQYSRLCCVSTRVQMHWSRTVPRGEGGICSGHVCTHVYTYVYLVYRSSTTRSSWNSGPVLLQNIRVKQKKWGGRRNSALLKNWDTDKKSFLSSEKGVGVHTTKERMEMLVSHMSSNVWKRKEKYSNFFDHSHSSECIV